MSIKVFWSRIVFLFVICFGILSNSSIPRTREKILTCSYTVFHWGLPRAEAGFRKLIFTVRRAISILGVYWQLIHVKGESALHIVLVIKIESRSLERHMFKRTSVASIGVLESRSTIKVQLLKCSVIDVFDFDGRVWSLVIVFVRQTSVGRW